MNVAYVVPLIGVLINPILAVRAKVIVEPCQLRCSSVNVTGSAREQAYFVPGFVRIASCVLQGGPHTLMKNTHLRIHQGSFIGSVVKKCRLEVLFIIDKAIGSYV